MSAPLTYPKSRKSDVTENLHGTLVGDPYRWLEELNSGETREWIEEQNRLTFSFLEQIPERKKNS